MIFWYYCLFVICYIFFVLSLIIIPVSLYKLFKRNKDYIYISKFFLPFGYFCLVMFIYIFIYTALIKKTVILNSIDSLIAIGIMILLSSMGNFLLWIWTHYEIDTLEDRFVYSHLLFGKDTIYFNEIDILKSRYIFVFPKGKRDFGYEILELKMLDGKKYNFRLEDLFLGGDDLPFIKTIVFKLKIKREAIYKK